MLLIYFIIFFICAQLTNYYHLKMRKILKSKNYYVPFIPFYFNDYRIFKKMIREQTDINEINEYTEIAKKYMKWSIICILLIIPGLFIVMILHHFIIIKGLKYL